MKRFAILTVLLVAAFGVAYAQSSEEIDEVSLDRFEIEGAWYSAISSDNGFTASRTFSGGPAGREPIQGEDGDVQDENVLGVRVDFLRRGLHTFTVTPVRPIPIDGITKTISVWVAGRNSSHELRILVRDILGRTHSIYMGDLNFQGWRQLTAVIPAQSVDGRSGVVQRSHTNTSIRPGIEVLGFRVHTDLTDSIGSYYIYFDDLRASRDMFALGRDEDDPVDGW
ncbi:MAG: flagellar filament outer layer protein FlaA [Treponema sp.]|nr:flagellar filament outer layer protein FlaA [Treponema sp.]